MVEKIPNSDVEIPNGNDISDRRKNYTGFSLDAPNIDKSWVLRQINGGTYNQQTNQ